MIYVVVIQTIVIVYLLRRVRKEAFFEAILQNSTDLVFQVLSRDCSTVKYVNGPVKEIMGRSKDEILKKPWQTFVLRSDHAKVLSVLAQAETKPGKTFSIDQVRLTRPDASISYCEGRVIFSPQLNSYITNWRLITDRVLAEQDLLKAKNELQCALQLVKEGVVSQTKIKERGLAQRRNHGATAGYSRAS